MDQSPLQKLPPELRNRIYELALLERLPIAVSTHGPNEKATTPLLQTCRQIRVEASAIYYSGNTFDILPNYKETDASAICTSAYDALAKWLENMPLEARNALRRIRISNWVSLLEGIGPRSLEAKSIIASYGIVVENVEVLFEIESDDYYEDGTPIYEWVRAW